MSKNIVKTVVLIVIFFVGAYIGSITSLFNDQVELVDLYEGTEDFLG